MFDIVFDINITAADKSEGFIEVFEIDLCANPYWH